MNFQALPKTLGLLALAATIVPPLLAAFGLLGEDAMKAIMLAAACLWFAAAPRWLRGGDR